MASFLVRLGKSGQGVLTLSLEGSTLRLLRTKGGRVIGWVTLPFNPRLLRDGRIEDPPGLAEVIKNGLKQIGGSPGPLVVGHPGSRITVRNLAIPRIRGMRPDAIVPREARRILGPTADQQLVFWTPLTSSPLELRYFLLATPRAELSRLLETLSLSGLKARKIDARPLALARAVDEGTAILVRLESTDVDVTVIVDRVPQLVTRRAVELSMSAEDLLAEMIDMIQTAIGFQTNRPEGPAFPPEAPILLFGGHPFIDTPLVRALTEGLGRQVRLPVCPLNAPEDFPTLEYMVNLGLALKEL